MAGQLNKSWHKMAGEKQEHYDMSLVWLGLPYEDSPKERTVREVYRRKTGASGNPSSHYFRVRDDNRWVQRATDYDAHRQAQIQKAEDEAFAKVVGEIAEKEAISVERMRVEMANVVDDVGPEVRREILERLRDPDHHIWSRTYGTSPLTALPGWVPPSCRQDPPLDTQHSPSSWALHVPIKERDDKPPAPDHGEGRRAPRTRLAPFPPILFTNR